jgi:hypothetical protein
MMADFKYRVGDITTAVTHTEPWQIVGASWTMAAKGGDIATPIAPTDMNDMQDNDRVPDS